MPTTEQKIAILLGLIKDLAESDDAIAKQSGEEFTRGMEKADMKGADDDCYYVKIPGNGVIKICPGW